MTELLHGEIDRVEGLVQAGVGLMGLIMVGVVWVRTKAFVPTVGALLFAAFVTWAVHNVDFLQQKVDEEFQTVGMPTTPVTPDAGLATGIPLDETAPGGWEAVDAA